MAWIAPNEPRIEVERDASDASWNIWIRSDDADGTERIVTVKIPDRGEWRTQGPWLTTEGMAYIP